MASVQSEVVQGDKHLPLKGESLKIDGSDAFVILPQKVEGKTPWVWYAPTLPGLPSKVEVWMFERFLSNGIAIAGIDVGESYGSPEGRQKFSALYEYLVMERQFSAKPCLLARSRGGLMLYNWAVENSEKVSGIAGIYPVSNLVSYPGLEKAAGAYKMTADELKKELVKHNPIDRLKPLAEKRVPILHLHGDQDKPVPYEKNTAILAERYKALGGPIEVELFKGRGHNMWEGWFQSEKLTQFVIDRALSVADNKPQRLKLPGIKINAKDRYVDVDAKVCLQEGALELIACAKGTKDHEAIIVLGARPMHIHTALLLLGAKPGNPAGRKRVENGDWIYIPARGDKVKVSFVITDENGEAKESAISEFLASNDEDAEKFPTDTFIFAGSHLITQEKGPKLYLCEQSGNVISLSTFGDELLCLPERHGHENGELLWQVNSEKLPALGAKVVLRLRPQNK